MKRSNIKQKSHKAEDERRIRFSKARNKGQERKGRLGRVSRLLASSFSKSISILKWIFFSRYSKPNKNSVYYYMIHITKEKDPRRTNAGLFDPYTLKYILTNHRKKNPSTQFRFRRVVFVDCGTRGEWKWNTDRWNPFQKGNTHSFWYIVQKRLNSRYTRMSSIAVLTFKQETHIHITKSIDPIQRNVGLDGVIYNLNGKKIRSPKSRAPLLCCMYIRLLSVFFDIETKPNV